MIITSIVLLFSSLHSYIMEKKGCNIFDSAEFGSMTAGLQLAQCMLKGKSPPLDPHNCE